MTGRLIPICLPCLHRRCDECQGGATACEHWCSWLLEEDQ